MKAKNVVPVIILLTILYFIGKNVWFSDDKQTKPEPVDLSKYQEMTISTYDIAVGDYLPSASVWDSYTDRKKVVDEVTHGTKVHLTTRVGDGCVIITPSGKNGWISYYFIKEFVLKEGIPVWDEKTGDFKNIFPDPKKLD